MSHQTAPAVQPYTISLFQDIRKLDHNEVTVAFVKIINVMIIALLAALVLRVFLGLFMVTGPLANFTMIITQPFVAPFDLIIKFSDQMLQISAAAAYCVYVPLYLILSASLKSSNTKEPLSL